MYIILYCYYYNIVDILDKGHGIPNVLSLRVYFEFIRESQRENNDYSFLWTNEFRANKSDRLIERAGSPYTSGRLYNSCP